MNKEKIKKDYMAGLTYKKIQKKYHITKNELKYLIEKENWTRTINDGYKGNQNAKGNRGGPGAKEDNKYAVTTGEHENIYNTAFSDIEKTIYSNDNIDLKQTLIKEINLLQIREFRMLDRIEKLKSKEMFINSITKESGEKYSSTTTNAENSVILIQKIEEALTRVQTTKRRYIETLNRLKSNIPEDNTERIQIINDLPELPILGDEENGDTTNTS